MRVKHSRRDDPKGHGFRKRLCRLWSARDGAMALEFAIVGPIIIVMLVATFEIGRYFMMASSLQYAVEEAGRYAMTYYTREYWNDKTQTDSTILATLEPDAEDSQSRSIGWINTDFQLEATPKTGTDPSTLLITGTTTFEFFVPLIPIPDITITRQTEVPMIKFNN